MSLFRWLKSLFVAPKRDVSRLEPGAEGADAVEEAIDTSGGPLKENHRRRALRDKRLLPKVRAARLPGRKRKKIMSMEEATRVFAGTMRTRNRNLRDLLADEEQLERFGLPAWRTEKDLADALGLTQKQLWFFSSHRALEQAPHYVTFAIPKRSGGKRLIMAPKRRLKAIQRKLREMLVEKLPVSEHAHGFRKARSIRTGAEGHVGKRVVLRLDLKDFFPTVTFARVRGLLIAYGYSFPLASALAALMTEAARQPVEIDGKIYHVPVGPRHCAQGAPTSPGLCNAILLRLDRRLAGLARKSDFTYTRYADDLSFSGNGDRDTVHRLRACAIRVVRAEGFEINQEKTRVMGRGRRQSVTGVVVNQELGLSRPQRRLLRAMAHRLAKGGTDDQDRIVSFQGKLAYLQMLNPKQADVLRSRWRNT